MLISVEAPSTDAELTSDRIVRDIEILQIDKVAELLGKAAYRNMAITSTTKYPRRPSTEPTSELIVGCIENFQIHKFSELLGQLS